MTLPATQDAVPARALVQRVRWHVGLSQKAFALAFGIDPDRLRDLEGGDSAPDPVLQAYLRVIDQSPDLVRKALDAA
ncbi:DNA-binding transcriptional regulator YiaG [Caulobacter ginsengisoli]|uniref:DNA-binding transcriptional regulator YiaG n=1 Tax=Caulobacter ginsengisoli TaxID=400775 RepID=A0ABU0IV65_9CAUL|nr:helix-turn-helix transcriptional regulator [Caulobacter ginsengisoli]MDQ0465912.1 DNA-binding transcriptional regulator YiaG [Caulobacter ginsengisoli]